ncbi:SPJ_0845 family protein [Pediococcus argentinicus]|nr:SPJ_0845 family protein [Pediococcus argentinicus]NKZ22138.1 hypothetical protein [Pediococcus argentinicus]
MMGLQAKRELNLDKMLDQFTSNTKESEQTKKDREKFLKKNSDKKTNKKS